LLLKKLCARQKNVPAYWYYDSSYDRYLVIVLATGRILIVRTMYFIEF